MVVLKLVVISRFGKYGGLKEPSGSAGKAMPGVFMLLIYFKLGIQGLNLGILGGRFAYSSVAMC